MQMATCPSVQRCRVHHFSTSNPPGSLAVCKKKFLISNTKFLSLFSDVLEATQDLMGSSPSQSQSSAVLLSLLLFIQVLLLPILPAHSLSPLRAGILPHIHDHCQVPALGCCGVPVPPLDCAPSEGQIWVPNCVYIEEGAALGELSLHHTSPPRQAAPDLLKAIVTRRLCSVTPRKGSGSCCAKLT